MPTGKRGRKRIVVISNGSVLTASVARLFQTLGDLKVAVLSRRDPKLSERIGRLDAQVVVLDVGRAPSSHRLLGRLLSEHPRMTVVALNLDRPDLQVYQPRLVEASPDGLLAAVRERRRSPRHREPAARVSTRPDTGGEATKAKQ